MTWINIIYLTLRPTWVMAFHRFLWDVINNPWPNLNTGLAKPPLKMGWLIKTYIKQLESRLNHGSGKSPVNSNKRFSVRPNNPISSFSTWRVSKTEEALMRFPWWRHQMETSSASLALCAGNSPVTGELPSQRPVTRSFNVFFDLRLNKRLS